MIPPPILIVLGNCSALAQKIICPAPKPTEAASATSSAVNAPPFQVSLVISSTLVPKSRPIHFADPCAGFVEAKLLSASKLPVITISLPL